MIINLTLFVFKKVGFAKLMILYFIVLIVTCVFLI